MLKFMAVLAMTGSLLASASALYAQSEPDPTSPGRATASSYGPLPVGMPMIVRPWDDYPTNLKVKSGFTDALSRRGIKISDDNTALRFTFETEVESLSESNEGPTLGQAQGNNWDKRIRMNLWSTTQDSLTTGRRSSSGGSGTIRYVVRAMINDPRNGQRLWQGEASYIGAPYDEVATLVSLAPVVVEMLGETVRLRNFRID